MINRLRNTPGNPVWQRNYYEHVIRTEKELNQIREYMVNNPMQWELDTEHPQNIQGSELKHE
jgi:REP element-mobilizing transposase RayT